MILSPKWEEEVINELESDGPCSVSLPLVEPAHYGHPLAIGDKLVNNIEEEFDKIQEPFWQNWKAGKYSFPKLKTWSHPIFVSQKDFLNVDGYSNSFDMKFWPGNFSDDAFAARLSKLYNGTFRFKNTTKACVYHAQSQTLKKIKGHVPDDMFERVYGINLNQFKRNMGQYEKY